MQTNGGGVCVTDYDGKLMGEFSLTPEICLYCEVGRVRHGVCVKCGAAYTGRMNTKNKKRKCPQSFNPSFSRKEEKMLRSND